MYSHINYDIIHMLVCGKSEMIDGKCDGKVVFEPRTNALMEKVVDEN